MTKRTTEERFWVKVDRRGPDECWLWLASQQNKGYGHFNVGGRAGGMVLAHRFAYQLLVGPVPEGLELDHLCRNALCVNPVHLEPVTHAENIRRGNWAKGAQAYRAAQPLSPHCGKGHLYDEANTAWDGGHRRCRQCKRAKDRRRYARKKPQCPSGSPASWSPSSA